jgi:hypothetical protein
MFPVLDSDGKLPIRFTRRIPFGTFIRTTNQSSGGVTSENLITFDTDVSKNMIEHGASTSVIKVFEAGLYWGNIRITVNASASNKTIELYPKVNGVIVANAAVHESLPNTGDQLISRVYVAVLAAGDTIEWAWVSRDDASMIIEANAAGVSPTSPASPSAVFNLMRVSP